METDQEENSVVQMKEIQHFYLVIPGGKYLYNIEVPRSRLLILYLQEQSLSP